MHRLFKLGGFCFAADHPDTLVFPPNFLRFETKDVQPAYFYTLRFVKSIPNPVGVCTAVREDLIVYRDGEKESRLLGIQGMLGFYALYRELDDTHAEVMIAEDCRGCLVFDPVFASLFALERRMLQKDSFILHSAYIRHRGRAILFSAPSGTGKSTQASLWAQYAGAEIINGDRCFIAEGAGLLDGARLAGLRHVGHLPKCGCAVERRRFAAAGEKERRAQALARGGIFAALRTGDGEPLGSGGICACARCRGSTAAPRTGVFAGLYYIGRSGRLPV